LEFEIELDDDFLGMTDLEEDEAADAGVDARSGSCTMSKAM
jgi:hypothetical protein